jgi:hypothetical protein
MILSDFVGVTTALSQTPASQTVFGIPALLVDHADIPLDVRYRIVTKSGYASDLTASTDATSWCASLWGQTYNPASAYICRWVSAATSPYFVRGPAAETTIATWAAVSDGSLTVTTTAGADALTGIDFTGDTTLANVAATMDAKLVAGGVSGARCYADALDRLYFVDEGVTGAGADTVVLSGGGGGTDLYLAAWLDGANGWQVGGADIEAQGTAVAAVLALTDVPYVWCQRGGSTAQVTALSTAINALNKMLFIREGDTTAKAATTSDVSYAIEALGHNRTYGIYTEHTVANSAAADQNPDAAVIGEITAKPDGEGTRNYALTPLTGVSRSGLDNDLTTTKELTAAEVVNLRAKGCDFLSKPSTLTHCVDGLAYGGQEVRVMVARDWFNTKVMEDTYAYLIAQEVVTFSDRDISAVKGIIQHYADVLVDRGCLNKDYTIEMPLASSFTATQKATHTMPLSNVLDADVEIAVNDMTITMSWSV